MATIRKTLRKNSTAEKRMMIFDLIKVFSYSEVGELMGMSKSGVAGFVFRDKHKKPKRVSSPHAHTVKKVKNKINLDMPVVNEGITIFELKENTCRYMIGDHKYCGQDVALQSYCKAHAEACYVTPKKRWR